MTNYSIFTPSSDDPDDVLEAHVQSFLHGVARALLDNAEIVGADHTVETQTANATDYHSPRMGWEVDAIRPDDRERFVKRIAEFAETFHDDLTEVCAAIAREAYPPYVGHFGGEWYRAGELYYYDSNGEGIGLWEYGPAGERLSGVIGLNPITAYAFPVDHPHAAHVELSEV
ncbi:hypothetical protein E1091_03445 [Micromonospora fluostatini]|uniref:DUF3500 domain-containing protein n=1 Tax=Micromonospora fluostatini TaxID=1629071 RepID=A0ABY2DQC4_9ACTN|nr:hypothetical protein E1091_03445 [Micromonospora fluostatini]